VKLLVLILSVIGCASSGRIEVFYGRMPSPPGWGDCNVKGTLADLDGWEMWGVIVELRQGKRRLVTRTSDWGLFCFSAVPPGLYDLYYWGEDANDQASDTVHQMFVRPLQKASVRARADVKDGATFHDLIRR